MSKLDVARFSVIALWFGLLALLPALVLIRRRDLPMPVFLFASVAPMGALLAALFWLEGAPPSLLQGILVWGIYCCGLWMGSSGLMALAAWLRPGEPFVQTPRRGLALASIALLGAPAGYVSSEPLLGLLLVLPTAALALLASRSSPRIEASLADFATLQLVVCLILVDLQITRMLAALWLRMGVDVGSLLAMVPSLLVAAIVLWKTPRRRRTWALVAPFAAVWLAAPLDELERRTRTSRHIAALDASALPVGSGSIAPRLFGPACIETPQTPCDTQPVLLAWPADAPIHRRLVAGDRPAVLYTNSGEIGIVNIVLPGSGALACATLSRDGARYQIAGRSFDLPDADHVLAEAQSLCGCSVSLDPEIPWTAQEIVSLCANTPCLLGEATPTCRFDAQKGWTALCSSAVSCSPAGRSAHCEDGGCNITFGADPSTEALVSCPKGRCRVIGGWSKLQLDCAGGGCTVASRDPAEIRCAGGGCVVDTQLSFDPLCGEDCP